VQSLHEVGLNGRKFEDSVGDRRFCYTRIAAYLADYPEQVLINITPLLSSPVTTAGYHDLGDEKPHPRRTREWVLSRLRRLREQVDTNDVAAYMAAAKEMGLNAVDQPFWEDLPGYQPDLVICPDILHGLLRMWRDHILKWVRHLVGVRELDNHVKKLQPLIGMHHFNHGISSLSQWTGCEDRELQRVLLAAIAGAPGIDHRVMRCLRAFHDFLYLAQYRSHSTTTLEYLEQSLRVFHSLKKIFIVNGARRGEKNNVIPHFKIPKLSALHMYSYHIPLMGSSMQFSTEIMETCHQLMAKAPYKATNGRDFVSQMCAYMNRQASIALVEEVGIWYFEKIRRQNPRDVIEAMTPDYEAFVKRMTVVARRKERLELRWQNRADNGYVWLTIKPDKRNAALDDLLKDYRLKVPVFHESLISFTARYQSQASMVVPMFELRADAWHRCRVQRTTIQDEEELADARTIQAVPPSKTATQYGLCGCALIRVDDQADVTGIDGMTHSEDSGAMLTPNRLSCRPSVDDLPVESARDSSATPSPSCLRLLVHRNPTCTGTGHQHVQSSL
jgi:Plavaka transposase